MENSIRKELISYYKWIVNLSIFVVTIIVSLISASDNLYFSDMLKWGICLLGVSIFFNWLLIKRLVTLPIVKGTAIENVESIHLIFLKSMFLAKIYGLFQNWFFILGIALVIISFILGLNNAGFWQKIYF